MYVYVYQKSKSGKLNFGHVKCTLDRGDEKTITSMQHVFFTKASLMGRQCHISSRTASLLLSYCAFCPLSAPYLHRKPP